MFKKISVAVLALIAAFAGYVAVQPSEFLIERTALIAAPAPDVFAHVEDFHKWENWSPWAKLDPAAKVAFEGPASGQGTVMAWAGNEKVGEGRMTLVESRPNEQVKIKVDFVKPFEGTSTSAFAFKPDGNQTAVTWSMSGHNNFIARAICLFMNMEKEIGGQMEKGLAKLKQVAEAPR